MNVLLVDDEPFELEQLGLFIKPLFPHWNLFTSVDGHQALALSAQIHFQLAFLDIRLPGKSGLELANELKAKDPEVKIVIITAYQDFQSAKESIKLGVVDYLTKPIIESELRESLFRIHGHTREEYSSIVELTLSAVRDRYAEKLALNDIAQQIHVNPSYLSRRFSEQVKMSFSEYVLNYRIEKAKILLVTNTDWNIFQIAEATGFASQHYFSTMFRKITGLSPRAYREMGK
ncbi:putative response regulatory protein [Peptococcaceae bacterium CEB3]|nr:putative response regulatory protein [Peptococcaceae bacterium CEB3]